MIDNFITGIDVLLVILAAYTMSIFATVIGAIFYKKRDWIESSKFVLFPHVVIGYGIIGGVLGIIYLLGYLVNLFLK